LKPNSSHQTFLYLLGGSALVIFLANQSSGPVLALGIGLLICVLTFLLRGLFLPPGAGATKVRTASLVLWFGFISSHAFWAEVINGAAKALSAFPELSFLKPFLTSIHLHSAPGVLEIIATVVVIGCINYFMVDRSIAGTHPISIDKHFPDQTFAEQLRHFCSGQAQYLETTDKNANWSPIYYTELDAEVEIVDRLGKASKRRLANLHSAIRSDKKTQGFIVLGDPGAGKSVALRKLARDMMKEVGGTGRVPIYINLREWAAPTQTSRWTQERPPNSNDVEDFVIAQIRNRGDRFTELFTDKYFADLWRHGRLFFIFDSFDEIPELLDATEESWLIRGLSTALSNFIQTNPNSRGLVASRVFRRPSSNFLATKILDIRPLSERKIAEGLSRFPGLTDGIRTELFRDRMDLIPVARNPFLMALLGEWISQHKTLPSNQAQLYENYLSKTLQSYFDRHDASNLTLEIVLEGAKKIATFVFNSPELGLEAPMKLLEKEIDQNNITGIIEILSNTRIARVSSNEPRSFAFVHRRFLEYFVTIAYVKNQIERPFEDIPTDSRGRDALVLYAQICDEVKARSLAEKCWSEVKLFSSDRTAQLRAIHCIRFLIDAFRSRRQPLGSFEKDLAYFIRVNNEPKKDLVVAKISLEATGLIPAELAAPILISALDAEDRWLQETAFRACRQLPNQSPEIQHAIEQYVARQRARNILGGYRDLMFSLSLSESMSAARQMARIRFFNILAQISALGMLLLLMPGIGFGILFSFPIVYGLHELSGFSLAQDKHPNHLIQRHSSHYKPIVEEDLSPEKMLRGTFHLMGIIAVLLTLATSIYLFVDIPSLKTVGNSLFEKESIRLKSHFDLRLAACGLLGGLAFTNWGYIKRLFSTKFSLIKRILLFVENIGSISLAAIGTIGGVLIGWAILYGFLKLPSFLRASLGAVSSLLLACAIIWYVQRRVFALFSDWKISSSLAPNEWTTRSEVASNIAQFRSRFYRLRYVGLLAALRVAPGGEWPKTFELSNSGDMAVSALARLEEKWRGLDR
jgi:NACHT domain